MSESISEHGINGIERFSHLEDRIFRVVEVFKALKKENSYLRRESMALKEENLKLKQELDRLQEKHEEVKSRVELVLNKLSAMEQTALLADAEDGEEG